MTSRCPGSGCEKQLKRTVPLHSGDDRDRRGWALRDAVPGEEMGSEPSLQPFQDNCGVDGQAFHIWVRTDSFENLVECALFDPAIAAPLNRLIGTEPIPGHIAPTCSRTSEPHSASKKRRPLLRGPRLPLRPPGTNGFSNSHCASRSISPSIANLQKSALNLIWLRRESQIVDLSPQSRAMRGGSKARHTSLSAVGHFNHRVA